MKSLTEHLIEESIINKYDSGYSGISKVLSNNKIKSIDFVFDVSGSTYGFDYKKWTNQADMIIKQAGQWGIRERDCNFWEAHDGQVSHLRQGQSPTSAYGSTTGLQQVIAEINPNPYQLIVYFTDDFDPRAIPNNIRGTIAIVAPDYLMPQVSIMDRFESRGVYFIPDNDINKKRSIISTSGGGRKSAMDNNDAQRIKDMMQDGCVIGDDGVMYVVSPESILFVYDESVYSPEVVADVVKYMERQGVKWKYRSDAEALRNEPQAKRIR